MKKPHYINYSGTDIEFPAIIKVCFAPMIESLRKQSGDADKTVANFATELLKEIEKYPALEEGFTDQALLKKYEEPIAKLMRTIFPDALATNEIKGAAIPFSFTPFFVSTRFRNILNAAGGDFQLSVMDFSPDEIYIFSCCVILANLHFDVDVSAPFKMKIPDNKLGITKTYRVAFNADMISVMPTDKAPKITAEDYAMLIDGFNDIKLWKEKFPPGSYILSGIGIVNLMDITVDQSIAGITTNLLSKSEDTLEQIAHNLRVIFKKPGLRVGYINYEDGNFWTGPEHKSDHSIVLSKLADCKCGEVLCEYSYEQLLEKKEPLVITDINRFDKQSQSKLSKVLLENKIGSYIAIPLIYEEELLGFVELASENKYELTLASLTKLKEVLPIISMAISHFKTESKNEIEAVIQREFTQIHPSVKWKFEEEAMQYILKKHYNKEAILEDLDFPNVFPLYGQLDIKDSSVTRNEVIQKDMTAQLRSVKAIMSKATQKKPLPVYEELIFRIDEFIKEINNGLQAGSEHEILHFLKKDIYPVFGHLKKADRSLTGMIKKYEEQLDPQTKVIYDERKKFDESIAMINNALTNHLDKRQSEAQQMYPHYFERYKTDGIEYNIYIGESIGKGQVFDKMFVRNLQLWQLMIMSELENEFAGIKDKLPKPLEIASLIMVHSDPLAIHFRLDEKRFDVKGAYNARYEIIKSRIDKAYVKGTNERITSPGKVVIVYSNEQDAAEYLRYIDFLVAKGYYKKGTLEKLLLEDMQGITGLQALRVSLNYSEKIRKDDRLSIDELMEAMQHNQV